MTKTIIIDSSSAALMAFDLMPMLCLPIRFFAKELQMALLNDAKGKCKKRGKLKILSSGP